jgi:hypothetical protein
MIVRYRRHQPSQDWPSSLKTDNASTIKIQEHLRQPELQAADPTPSDTDTLKCTRATAASTIGDTFNSEERGRHQRSTICLLWA